MLSIILFTRILNSTDITCTANFTIESDIIGIEYSCFYKCRENLSRILFNENPQLVYIGDNAFSSCEKLITMDLKTCNNLKSIGSNAFFFCYNLIKISLPRSVEVIDAAAFISCTHLKTVSFTKLKKLKIIQYQVFYGNTNLIRVDLPSSVLRIESDAFNYCYNLTVLNFGENSQLQFIDDGAFFNTNLTNLVLPKNVLKFGIFLNTYVNWTIHKDNPYFIDDNDFIYNLNKTILYTYKGRCKNIIVHEKVKVIYQKCFYENNDLESVQIGKIDRIGSNAFSYSNFSVTIDSIGIIEDNAFSSCKSHNITIKNYSSPGIIGKNAFQECKLVDLDFPEGLEIISSHAFSSSSLKSIKIPSSLKQIHAFAFSFCNKLNRVNISENSELQYIGSFIFLGTNFYNFKVPRKVTTVGNGDLIIDADHPYFYIYDGFLMDRNNANIFKYNGLNQTIIIPDNVRHINDYCFYENNIKNIQFPSSLESIGDYAFYQCSKLRRLDFNNVTTIGNYAFYKCSNLASIDFGNVKTIGNLAFYECDFLTFINLRNVRTIGNDAFYSCINLESCELRNVRNIGSFAFFRCAKFQSISIRNVTVIKYATFGDCFKLNIIDLQNVDILKTYAFFECRNLRFINLNSVSIIEKEAFHSCNNLELLFMPNIKEIQNKAFYRCDNLEYVYISDKLKVLQINPFHLADVYVPNNDGLIIQKLASVGVPTEKIFSFYSYTQAEKENNEEELQFYKLLHPYIRVR